MELTKKAYPPPPTKAELAKAAKTAAAAAAAENAAADDVVAPHRLDIRVGKIVQVGRHPDADALYVEQIDLGTDLLPTKNTKTSILPQNR